MQTKSATGPTAENVLDIVHAAVMTVLGSVLMGMATSPPAAAWLHHLIG